MKLSEWIRKSQFSLMLALGTYCLLACIAGYLYPRLMGDVWMLPCAYVLLCWLGLLLPGKGRVALGVIGTAVFFLPAVFLRGEVIVPLLIAGVLYGALLFYSLTFGGWDRTRELTGGWIGFCLALLLAGCLLTGLDSRLEAIRLPIRVSFYSFMLLAMLSLNRSSRNLATFGKQGVSAAMGRKNLLLTLGMFAIALVPALIPALGELLQRLVDAVARLLEQLKNLFPEETEPLETTVETVAETVDAMGGLMDDLKKTQTPTYVYTIIVVIALGAAVPAVIYAVRKFGSALRTFFRQLYGRLSGDLFAQQEDFEEEITDIRKEVRQTEADRGRTRRPVMSFGKLTPAEKIRYRYRKLAQKHPEWKAHNTARENLPETAAQLYEKARYSHHPVEEKEVALFKTETQ